MMVHTAQRQRKVTAQRQTPDGPAPDRAWQHRWSLNPPEHYVDKGRAVGKGMGEGSECTALDYT